MKTAAELFANKGFVRTTTKAIADACHVSEATIFKHFQTKEDLYDAIIRDHVQAEGNLGLTDELVDSGDDRAFFVTFAVHFLRHKVEDQVFWRLLVRSALDDHELANRFFDAHVNQGMEFLAGYIRRRQEAGAVRPMDPGLAASFFVGMLGHYLHSTQVFSRPELQNVSIETVADNVVDVFLRGVAQEGV